MIRTKNINKFKTNFYVYIFLDPRKPGKFYYGGHYFEFQPYYVGKGKDNRHKCHIKDSQLNSKINPYKQNKMRAIMKLGYDPLDYLIVLWDDLEEKQAMMREMDLIKQIGRFDLKTGPLTNLTDGGEGMSGYNNGRLGKSLADCIGREAALRTIKINRNRIKKYGSPSSTPEAKLKISISNGRPIKQLDLNNTLIKVWHSLNFAAKSLKIGVSTIFGCLTMKEKSITAGGFKWEYVDQPNKKYTKEFEDRHKKNSKYYKILFEDGTVFYTKNLANFSQIKNVKADTLRKAIVFKRPHAGYRVFKVSRRQFLMGAEHV